MPDLPVTPSAYRLDTDITSNSRCCDHHYSLIDPAIAGEASLVYATYLFSN